MAFGIHEFYVKSFRGDIVHYCRSKEEALEMANKLNKVLGYDNYLVLNGIAFNNIRKYALRVEDNVGKESGRWSASEHNYKDLEKNVNKQAAYGTKYWNMSYDELVNQGLWKDADNNIYIISSMRNGHIANIMDMLNTVKYSLDMSPETKEKYKNLFLDEFRIRNALKNSEPQFLSKEPQFLSKEEHNDFHEFSRKENDVVNRPASKDEVHNPNHYSQTRISCIRAIEAMVEPYENPIDAMLSYQVLKYLWRHPWKKNPLQDLEKCEAYLKRLIDFYKGNCTLDGLYDILGDKDFQ